MKNNTQERIDMKPLKPFFLDLTDAEIAGLQEELGDIFRRGELILGRNTEAFEAEFARYTGAAHAISMNTATSALEVLMVLNGAKGKKVAIQANTNFASAASIVHAGGTPVFIDMTADYFCPNLDILKAAHARHGFEGVMWVHSGGIIVPDFAEVAAWCRETGIFLVEDAAHAHGSVLGGKHAGTIADGGGAYSFFATKVMTTMEGGMLVTNNQDHADLAKSFRNQGKRHAAFGGLHYDMGSSWRISEIAAKMGSVQLAKLDKMVATRQAAVDIIAARLDQIGVKYCKTDHMDSASQYKFIIIIEPPHDPKAVKEKLAAQQIFCGGGVYEVPLHEQPVFQPYDFDPAELAVTSRYCPLQICPPITSGTTVEDAHRIAAALVEALS
jgi:perosamine synthetase